MNKITRVLCFLLLTLFVNSAFSQIVTFKDLVQENSRFDIKVASVKNAGVDVGYVVYYHDRSSGSILYKARYYDLSHNQIGGEQQPFGSGTVFAELSGILDWSLTSDNNLGIAIATEKGSGDIIGYHTVNPSTGLITEVMDERPVAGFTGNNGSAQAVILNNGNIAVAYVRSNSPNNNIISFDIVNPTTNTAIVSNSNITNDGLIPQTTLLADGSFIVSFQRVSDLTYRAKRYSQSGVLIGSEMTIFSNIATNSSQTLLSDGRLLFHENRRAKHISFTPTGNTLGNQIQLIGTALAIDNPKYTLASFKNGGFILGFLETDGLTYQNLQYKIYNNNGVETFSGTNDVTPQDLSLIAESPYFETLTNGDLIVGLGNNRGPNNTNANLQLAVVQGVLPASDPVITLTASASSANENGGSITLTATADVAPSSNLTVNLGYSGTAIGGTDYTQVSAITIPSGMTAGTATINFTGDPTVEADETIVVDITSLTGVTATEGSPNQQTLTITNDDTTVVTIADVSANENAGAQTITATLTNPVQGGFAFDVFTTDGTGTTADSDYSSTGGSTLTFSGTAGETQTLNLSGLGDSKVEADETFTIGMTNLGFTSVDPADINITDVATYTILNDDTAAVTIADVSVNENSGTMTFTLTLNNEVDRGFTVDTNTADGTALISNLDYLQVTNQTEFFTGTAGETQNFSVILGSDSTSEPDETFTVFMNNLVASTVDVSDITITDTAIGTILNDDSVSASVNDPSVAEGASGNTTLPFTVTLSGPAPAGGATVDFATSNGTATAGSDYTATSGTLSFSVGETSKTVDVTVSGDAAVEVDETITLTLSNPTGTNVLIGDATGAGTITNDDSATVTIADIAVNENAGTATVTLTLDNAVDGGFNVNVSTSDNTATTADGDYTAVFSQIETFAGTAGETETFAITIGADNKVEPDETIDIAMSNLVPSLVAGSDITITDTATVTILNDDFTVGGEVTGLEQGNSVVIQNNGGDDLTVNADGSFTFLTALNFNSDYEVTVFTQPTSPAQTCTVTMEEGTISTTNITDVLVSCTTNQYFIGGTLTGLSPGNTVTLSLDNSQEQLPLSIDGSFAFAIPLNDLSEYTISVSDAPDSPSQTCEIQNATGQIDAADVENVSVTCTVDSFFIGGRVTGLIEGYSLRLENNSSDEIIQSTNGTFVFDTPLLDLSSYDVGFEILPANTSRDCVIENESGDLAGNDINNVLIRCNFFNDLIFYNGFELNDSDNR